MISVNETKIRDCKGLAHCQCLSSTYFHDSILSAESAKVVHALVMDLGVCAANKQHRKANCNKS